MKNTVWIWFVGCAVWLVDGIISLRYHSWQHAELAFSLAMLFFAAGMLYRHQQR